MLENMYHNMTYNANPSRFSLDEKGVHKMYTPTKGFR